MTNNYKRKLRAPQLFYPSTKAAALTKWPMSAWERLWPWQGCMTDCRKVDLVRRMLASDIRNHLCVTFAGLRATAIP